MLQRKLVFQALEASWTSLAVLALVVTAAVLVVVLSRYERRLVPPSVGYPLLLLRLAVIAVIWLALCQPVLTWHIDRSRTDRVIVAVDLSESMTTADRIATPAEKLRTAIGLGMIGNDNNRDRWLRVLSDYEAERDPQWIDDNEGGTAEQRVTLSQSRQELARDTFQKLEQMPRAEIAAKLLADKPDGWLAELQKTFQVELRVFGGKSLPSERETLPQAVQKPPDTLGPSITSLAAALETSSNEQAPVKAFVVLSDGRDTAGSDPVTVARRWRDLNVAVYPVLIGSERRPKDIVLDALEIPPVVYLNDTPIAKVTLQAAGFEGETLTVVLEATDGTTQSKTAIVPKTETGLPPSVTLEFPIDATQLGRKQFTVRTDVLKGETRDDNNARDFSLVVVDDKARVLIVDGEARWEFRFLEAAFARDERVQLESVLFEQPYLGVLPETFFQQRLNWPGPESAIEKSPLAEFDLVVVGDVSPRHLSEPLLQHLEKFVAEMGGTVIFVAGKRSLPREFRSRTLDKLLPVINARPATSLEPPETPPHLRGFHLRLTPDGELESSLQLAADVEANRTLWKSLPGHSWAMAAEAKAGATVLATADDGQPLPPELERSRALIVTQYYGLGQVFWLGFDSTWRWRHRVGDQHHHRFWGQMARTAAQNKASAGNEFVKFGLESTDVPAGQDVVFRARWTPLLLARRPHVKAKVEVFPRQNAKPDQPVATIDLTPDPARTAVHQGHWAAPNSGEFKAVLQIEGPPLGGPADKEIAAEFLVRGLLTKELADVTATRSLLEQIAQVSNGRLLLPHQLAELPKLIQPEDLSLREVHEYTLWDHWLLLAVLCALLTTEWIIRKWNGLP